MMRRDAMMNVIASEWLVIDGQWHVDIPASVAITLLHDDNSIVVVGRITITSTTYWPTDDGMVTIYHVLHTALNMAT